MAHYRDDLEAARARIETLEARIREREASLEARDAELAELRAELARARRGQGGASSPELYDPPSRPRAALVALAACAFMTTAAYAVMRPARCSMGSRPPRATAPVEVQLVHQRPQGLPSRPQVIRPPSAPIAPNAPSAPNAAKVEVRPEVVVESPHDRSRRD